MTGFSFKTCRFKVLEDEQKDLAHFFHLAAGPLTGEGQLFHVIEMKDGRRKAKPCSVYDKVFLFKARWKANVVIFKSKDTKPNAEKVIHRFNASFGDS